MSIKQENRKRRHKRIRARIYGTSDKPRLFVFRSSKYLYAQLIDDDKGKTILAARGKSNVTSAKKVGKSIAKEALEKNIEKVVFDRGGYKYHGKIKALAEEARAGGLKF